MQAEDALLRLERGLTRRAAAFAPPPPPKAAIAWLALLWGASLLVGLAALQIAVALTLAVGGQVGGWHFLVFPVVAVAACLLAFLKRHGRLGPRRIALASAPLIALIAGSFTLAATTLDMSPDGQTAHEEAIIHLVNGWNPIRDPLFAQVDETAGPDYVLRDVAEAMAGEYIVRIGAKGTYYQAASAVALFDSLNVGKGFNLVLIAAAALLVLAAALHVGLNAFWAFAVAAAAALNPVAINQILTTYVDGQLGMTLTALAAAAVVLATTRSSLAAAAFAAALLLGVNAKITGFFYAGFLGLIALGLIRLHSGSYRGVVAFVAASAVGVLLVGYSPIVHNLLTEGRLLGYLDDTPVWTNSFILEHDRITKLLISLFSETHSNPDAPHLKVPFGISAFEWRDLTHVSAVDARIGGYGPWMSGALVLSVIILIIAAAQRLPGRAMATLCLLALIASLLPNREAWWARYVPHLWMAPVMIAAYGVSFPARSEVGALGRALMAVVLLNASYVAVKSVWMQSGRQMVVDRLLDAAATLPQPVTVYLDNYSSNRLVLRERGLDFVQTPTPCARFVRPPSLFVDFCLDNVSEDDARPFLDETRRLEAHLTRHEGIEYRFIVP